MFVGVLSLEKRNVTGQQNLRLSKVQKGWHVPRNADTRHALPLASHRSRQRCQKPCVPWSLDAEERPLRLLDTAAIDKIYIDGYNTMYHKQHPTRAEIMCGVLPPDRQKKTSGDLSRFSCNARQSSTILVVERSVVTVAPALEFKPLAWSNYQC